MDNENWYIIFIIDYDQFKDFLLFILPEKRGLKMSKIREAFRYKSIVTLNKPKIFYWKKLLQSVKRCYISG